jgi:hypothetical protein
MMQLKLYNLMDYPIDPWLTQLALTALADCTAAWQMNLSISKCGSLCGNNNYQDGVSLRVGNTDLENCCPC